MNLSAFTWQLYRDSVAGQAAIRRSILEFVVASPGSGDDEAPFDRGLWMARPGDDEGELELVGMRGVNLQELIGTETDLGAPNSQDEADALFTSIVEHGMAWDIDGDEGECLMFYGGGEQFDDGYEQVIASIDGLTAGLHTAHPDHFFPYLFPRRFDEFRAICERYGIELPELPGKGQKRERAMYYVELNRRMQAFRRAMGMSPAELNAFLYDFAPKDLGRQEPGELPAPSRVWFVMGGIGGNGDFEFLDEAHDATVSFWQGNLETRRGDAVVMWCVAPRSYIHSIWRATDDGFIDPYFHFYSTIRVGRPTRVPPIKFSELAKHPVFADHPAIRAHFQGRNGMAFTVREYEALRQMLREKGFDPSSLPPAPAEFALPNVTLRVERDVEVHLVEPLLRRLGFADSEWRYQMRIRMGRGERNVPDYVLGADDTPGDEQGVALIECKYDIATGKERKDAFLQGKSYAHRLRATVLALAARQGLWMYQLTSRGFDEDQHTFKTWDELRSPDKLAEIDRLLGKRRIDTIVNERDRPRRSRLP